MKKTLSSLFFFLIFLAVFLGVSEAAMIYNPKSSAHLLLSSYYLYPREKFLIKGRMFGQNERVELSVGSLWRIVSAGRNGEFASSFLVPTPNSSPKIEVVARGLESGVVRRAELVVASYYPKVEPSGYYIRPGESLEFQGSGFAPNEVVTVRLGDKILDNFKSGETGNFQVSYRFPYSYPFFRDHVYTFIGNLSGREINVRITSNFWF